MTLYDSTQLMNQKIKEMYNTLYNIMQEYIDIDSSLTFTELVEKVGEIPGERYYYKYNTKPANNIEFKDNDTLLRKEINIYYKIQFLTDYLIYALILKGIPKDIVDKVKTLHDAIELVDLIRQLKPSTLTLDIQEYNYYYNSYCTIPYTLTSDDKPITDGYITVLEDDIEIAYIPVGETLKFLPTSTGTHIYTIQYAGTKVNRPTVPQEYTFNILPAKITIEVSAKNIGESQYNNNAHIGYDEDIFQVTVITLNPYIDFPAVNVPFYIEVPQTNGKKIFNGTTDENGIGIVNITSNKIGTFDIFIQTITDGKKVSNNNTNYSITIYHNPIKIADYKFYETQNEREMELFFYDNNGNLTNQFLNTNYSIVIDDNYRIFNLKNKVNPLIIQEEHTELGTYHYKYSLKYQNKVIATTYNTVKVNKEIKIKIVPENKFLTSTTKRINVHIYTTDYRNQPLSIPVQFITSFSGLQDTIRTTNEIGYYHAQVNLGDICSNCNGFLLQAISADDHDIISNTIYYRINNNEALDTFIEIESAETYNLNNTQINVKFYLIDSEGEDIFRPIEVTDGIHTSTLSYIINKQCYEATFTLNDNQIGDDITFSATFTGETDHYLQSTNNKIVTFVKSNVNSNFTYSSAIVYETLNIQGSLNIENNNKFNKYIGDTVNIYMDNNEYTMTKNNITFTLSVTPLNAGNIEVIEQYLGNKWTNPFTNRKTIIIEKTSMYNFDITLDNNTVPYQASITFTPLLIGTTNIEQLFTGTITYDFSNGFSTTKNIEDYTYKTTSTGNQTVTINYSGDNNHNFKSITKQFEVTKLTPDLNLIVPKYDAIYDESIDIENPIPTIISYNNNEEHVTINIYKNNKFFYSGALESNNHIELFMDEEGTNIITLQTEENDNYNSISISKEIEGYTFIEELYKILLDINNEEDYEDKYEIALETYKIFWSLVEDSNDYDQNILERFYNVLNALGD